MIEFKVHDVEERPVTDRDDEAAKVIGSLLGEGAEMVACSDPDRRLLRFDQYGTFNPLLDAVCTAFAGHHPLALDPDAVWLTVAGGVATHRRLEDERSGRKPQDIAVTTTSHYQDAD